MHQKKAEILTKLNESSRHMDDAVLQVVDVALHPEQHGWLSSIGAAIIGLPLVGVSALAIAASEGIVKSIPDADFERDFPNDRPPAGDDPSSNHFG